MLFIVYSELMSLFFWAVQLSKLIFFFAA